MKGYVTNIEDDTPKTRISCAVIYTRKTPARFDEPSTQEEIGEETHTLDQFIRVETGDGVVILDGVKHQISLKVSTQRVSPCRSPDYSRDAF